MPDPTRPTRDASEGGTGSLVTFPRPRQAGRPSDNLPLQLTSFVGREREMAEVKRLLADKTRLLTLTGPGGSGKTRLALEVADDIVEGFEDGAWLVELASLSDPALVPQAVASTLGVREQPSRSLVETLTESVEPKEMLLVLDNCEHLIDACSALAETLLRVCPNLRILATSREALGVVGEVGWPVPSLSLPDPRHLPSVEELARYEAPRLFIERAAAVLPTFAPTERNASAVARVCRRLEGMPLAIELASTRVKVLPVEQIAERLDDCFHLLTGGSRVALPRHRTLRATIGWSHELLSEEEQTLFRRLSVFAGGFTLEAAEEVCAGEGLERDDVLDLLSHLVDKSLVVMEERGGEARYRFLETVRQYGQERLEASGEAESIRSRHADHYLALVEEAEPKLKSPEDAAWLERLEREHDNLSAAMRWGLAANDAEAALRMAAALVVFWWLRGHLSEGRGWLQRGLAHRGVSPSTRAKALVAAGWLGRLQGDHEQAEASLEKGRALSQEIGDTWGTAWALVGLAQLQVDPGRKRALAEESLALFRQTGEPWGIGFALNYLGVLTKAQGDDARAVALLEEGLTLYRQVGEKRGTAILLLNLGLVLRRRGDDARAASLLEESLALLMELGDREGTARVLHALGSLAKDRDEHERAARLYGAAEALREAIGAEPSPADHAAGENYQQSLTTLRGKLGENAFANAWAEGRAMTTEQAAAYALDEQPPPAVEAISPSEVGSVSAEAKVPPELRIFALGPARVYREEEALASSEWTYAKSRELLFYLLGHPSRTKAQIGLDLWPEASPSQLRSAFHKVLHHLRLALGRPEWVVFQKGRYAFDRSLNYFYDVEAFESKLAEARRVEDEVPAQAVRRLKEAVGLYGGDFLEDCAESEWSFVRQEGLRRTYQEALVELGGLLFAQGRYGEAAEAYQQLIGHDAFLEEAHREFMRCQGRLGERGRALRHYRDLVELLREELGSSPAPETTELYERLRRGEDI